MVTNNFHSIRDMFFRISNENNDYIYLDNAATTLKPLEVIKAMDDAYISNYGNIKRSSFKNSSKAYDMYEEARVVLKKHLNAGDDYDIIFTSGTTEAINLVAYSYGEYNLAPSDDIAVSVLEHHSNLLPWNRLAKAKGSIMHVIPMDEKGSIDFAYMRSDTFKDVKLVAITHASNVTGKLQDLEKIIPYLNGHGKLVLVDAAQSVPHIKIDLSKLKPDFMVFSAHKMLGPFGIGALVVKKNILKQMCPWKLGGGMVVQVENEKWKTGVEKFEAGTLNLPAVIGWMKAVEILNQLGMGEIHQYINTLTKYLADLLKEIPGLKIYDFDDNIGIVSFTHEDMHPHDIASWLDYKKIAIRAGHQCAQPLMAALKINSCIRASIYFYNTEYDIEKLAAALKCLFK